MEPISVFLQRESDFVPMHPVNSKKVWTRTMHKAAIDRACQLMEELGAGEVVGGCVDVYAMRRESRSRVPFEPERINALLGTDLTKEEMLAYLAKVELAL